jgi:hypothetical protein
MLEEKIIIQIAQIVPSDLGAIAEQLIGLISERSLNPLPRQLVCAFP